MNIIFVKVDTKYSIEHVNRLFRQLCVYAPNYKYFCYTDDLSESDKFDPRINLVQIDSKLHLYKVWNKLLMFNSDADVQGQNMYFDLDTIIQSNPFDIIKSIDFSKLTMVKCHWKRDDLVRLTNYDVTINSSVLAWDSTNTKIHQLWDHFINSGLRDYLVKKYAGIDRYLVHEKFDKTLFDYFPTDYIQSYKYEDHAKPAPVITFEELSFESIDFKQIA